MGKIFLKKYGKDVYGGNDHTQNHNRKATAGGGAPIPLPSGLLLFPSPLPWVKAPFSLGLSRSYEG